MVFFSLIWVLGEEGEVLNLYIKLQKFPYAGYKLKKINFSCQEMVSFSTSYDIMETPTSVGQHPAVPSLISPPC